MGCMPFLFCFVFNGETVWGGGGGGEACDFGCDRMGGFCDAAEKGVGMFDCYSQLESCVLSFCTVMDAFLGVIV